MNEKNDLRRQVRRQKKKYTEAELLARSERIWTVVEALPEFQAARTVAAYWSLPDEVYSHDFVEKWCSEKVILLPVMCADSDLELRQYRLGCTMNRAAYDIREPGGAVYDPNQVDLILVPGMAFDGNNHRLGRGKGFYDRLLSRMKAYKIGVCFDFQRYDQVPVDRYDVSMDCTVSG